MYARTNSPEPMLRIHPRSGIILLSLVVALLVAGSAAAQTDVNMAAQPPVTIGSPKAPAASAGPYVAEVAGDDVYIRSGPGTNYYQCGRLYRSDRVQVVRTEQGWSCIVPPPGCFSWVSMKFVSINLDNPTMGIITGDNVRIYAGSDFVEPMHSTSEQIKLFRGDRVKLLGEEKDDYYKIAPPEGAHLWVSSEFVHPVQAGAGRSVTGVEPLVQVGGRDPNEQVNPATESELLDVYYALSKLAKAERGKPKAEQNYTDLKAKLQEVVKNAAAGKAARYAEFTLKQVERFELACAVDKEIALQSQQLDKVTEKIDEARQERLAQIQDVSKFAIIGTLENSVIYGTSDQTKRYRILDASGKTICYAAPAGSAAGQDLSALIGKKVGLVGEIVPHEATARAMITFTQVVPID